MIVRGKLVKRYSDVSISDAGVRKAIECHQQFGMFFKIDADSRESFPYINGAVKGPSTKAIP